MTSRINYNSPLKSVRTIRALKIDQCDPHKIFVDDPARLSDADLMNEAGIAFVWENAPGRSKAEQEKSDAAAAELKPPPQQVLTPPPSSKLPSVEVPKSPPPAGTSPTASSNVRPSYDLFANNHLPSPEAAATADNTPSPNSRSKSSANHQLPPKPSQSRPPPPSVSVHQPQQSSDKPPLKPRRTTASVSVPQPGHHNSTALSRNGGYDEQSSHRTSNARSRGQEISVAIERHHHSPLASTLHALTTDEGPPPPHGESNRGSLVSISPDGGRGSAPYSDLNRGSQDYLVERLRQAPVQEVKDFYSSKRYTSAAGTVPTSARATLPNSCLPTRPNSASASETGSHSDDDDGDQTDAGDALSRMNMDYRDPEARCQVSVLDGEQHESSRHTDPHARDFIMERFLPAAKAMVTDTSEASERRSSSQETPLVSPTRGKGRPSLPGRSRFAFKDRFAEEEEEQEDVEQSDLLFKCKFPWQMGALRSVASQFSSIVDSRSIDQSPSASFGNSKELSPSPSSSLVNRKSSSPDDQHDPSRIYPESDGSITPRGDNGSFEDRRLSPMSKNNSGPITLRARMAETDYLDSNRALSLSGESANGEYSGRSNGTSARPFIGVPRDRLDETATKGDLDNGNHHHTVARRSPEMTFSGSLGALLRITQPQRRDLIKSSAHESIPPSSILNHHRYNPSHSAAAAKSSSYGGTNSSVKPIYYSNGAHPDESNSYSRHLQVNLSRQQVAEPSGVSERSLESLNDSVWEAGRESSSGSKSPAPEHLDQPGNVKLLTANNSNLSNESPKSPKEDMTATGWPLAKSYPYGRTASSDSKDASFSSISDYSLRSPTNQGLAIQQMKSSSEKYSPVSVLQPPLPKSPKESWLFKVRPPVPPSTGTNWQGTKPKKVLDYSFTDDSMDVKWEVMVKSENVQPRNKQEQKMGSAPLTAFEREILG